MRITYQKSPYSFCGGHCVGFRDAYAAGTNGLVRDPRAQDACQQGHGPTQPGWLRDRQRLPWQPDLHVYPLLRLARCQGCFGERSVAIVRVAHCDCDLPIDLLVMTVMVKK
jgi:hypothetical protein